MSGAFLRMLAETSIRASAAGALVAVALAATRARGSAVRHAAWTAVMFAMLLMPALTRWTPALMMPFSVSVPTVFAHLDKSVLDVPPGARGVGSAPKSRAPSPLSAAVSNGNAAPMVMEPTAPPMTPATRHPGADVWLLLACAAYGVVAAAMILRFLVGWWGAARVTRTGEVVLLPGECRSAAGDGRAFRIRESRAIAVPVTVGLMRQTILLPPAWRQWPHAKLRAVIAHEAAHVQRRDLLVAFVAHLNRCLWWFHPLSWWLERTLASTAEQAADERAMLVLGDRPAYASILVEMARAVTDGGGRIASLGVGIDGRGLLNQRIERALNASPSHKLSAPHKAVLAAACVGAILVAVACRPSAASLNDGAAVEQRDRTLKLFLLQTERRQWRDLENVDWDAEASALSARETAVRERPDDLTALRRFLVSYWAQYAPTATWTEQNPLVANKTVNAALLPARRALILRLIERNPDADLAGAVEAQIFPTDLSPFFPGDPLGYGQARAAWIAQTGRPNASPVTLGHAADFFETADRPLAEQMLVRARALDPSGPWAARLGQFYSSVLAGAQAPAGPNQIRTVSAAEPNTAYGNAVREKLGESNDELLLTAAGWFLRYSGERPEMGFDPALWGEACFTRALQINPRAVLAHSALLATRRQERLNHVPLWSVAPESLDASVAVLSERDRFEQLPELASHAYRAITEIGKWNDANLRARLDLERGHAQRYAEETLRLAPKFHDDPDYGTAIYTANMTLSALALRDGDRRAAIGHLQRASQAPASEQLAYGDDVVWRRELRDLVAQGERQAVIAFLEQMARTNIAGRIELREWAASLRRDDTVSGPYFNATRVTRNTSGDRRFADDPHARMSTQTGGICGAWGWIVASDTCFTATNVTLRELITYAFAPSGLVRPFSEILDGPDWIDAERFDVVGRAEGTKAVEPLGSRELAPRIRTLLAERFALTLHAESRPRPVYQLVLAHADRQLGPQLHPATPACTAVTEALRASLEDGAPALLPSRHDPCISMSGRGYFKGGAIDMPQLALVLSNRLDRIVRDRTGRSGMFMLDLTWGEGSSIFAALQEQLGLKLEPATRPVDVLVIDRVSSPRVN